jgi:hypothetical protein
VRTSAQLIEINCFSDRHFWREDYDKAVQGSRARAAALARARQHIHAAAAAMVAAERRRVVRATTTAELRAEVLELIDKSVTKRFKRFPLVNSVHGANPLRAA